MDKPETYDSEKSENQPSVKNDSKEHSNRKNRPPKKHYSEYLIQGLFIFASVSLGFLSQNIRERISSRDKEEQYVASYLRNLKVDSINLIYTIDSNLHKVQLLDSIILISMKDLSDPANRNLFLTYCFSVVSYYQVYSSNDATFIQLINSDGLRVIKRDHVADSISKYAADLKGVYAAMGLYAHATAEATGMAHEILDYGLLYDSSYFKYYRMTGKYEPTGKYVPFISNDPQKFKKFINKIYFERAATQNYINNLQALQPFLHNLMGYLEREYAL